MGVTLWLFNIAMENDPFIDDFPIRTTIYTGFSMAMLNNQRVSISGSQTAAHSPSRGRFWALGGCAGVGSRVTD